jgi:hypothetical protein
MWHLKQIPKIAHFYWGGGNMAYLRYLTVASFMRHNPTWDVFFYVPQYPASLHSWISPEQKYADCYQDCADLIKGTGATIKKIDFNSMGFSNTASEVHKSDFLRWNLLNIPGGIWSDMDIIFTRPMDDLCFNKEGFSDINAVVCIGAYGHSIGFLMGGIGNSCFNTIYQASLRAYNEKSYQCMGSLLCNSLFPNIASAKTGGTVPYNLPMDVVYSYDFNSYKELFEAMPAKRFTNNTIGVHWYGGSDRAGRYLNDTNGGFNIYGDSIIDNLIKNEN